MKRRRGFMATGSNAKRRSKKSEEVSHTQNQNSGPSLADLPMDILVKILLKLSIKWIFVCKSVCKTWYGIISDPEFAKMHFDQARVYPMIQVEVSTLMSGSGMIYLLHPDEDDFELKFALCNHKHFEAGCVCNVNVKLDTRFELPKRRDCFQYRIVNSCNGFLCLSKPFDKHPSIVCNPITGEFIKLPKAKELVIEFCESVSYGFGFSPSTNQYKVVRMLQHWTQTNTTRRKVEVHVIGSESWKDIGIFTLSIWDLSPTYLNGFLYWYSKAEPLSLTSFDIDNECFGSISSPAAEHSYLYKNVSMGVLGEELCVSGFLDGAFHVWAMKDHNAKKTWHQVFSFDMHFCPMKRLEGPLKPMKYVNNGSLLMFHPYKNAFIYMDSRKNAVRYLQIRKQESVEAIAYIPSFVSLKHALCGHNVKALEISRSRQMELKLTRRTKGICVVEENI